MSTRQRSVRRPPTRLRLAAIALALASALPALAAQPAATAGGAETVSVQLDHAKVVRLPEKAQTVIVGNPGIADVSVQKNGILIVTGKSFGVTNLIALDSAGKLLAESLVRVGAAGDAMVTVQRGLERETYSCTPDCQPAIQLGDSAKFFDERGGQISARNSLATGFAPK